MLFLKTKKIHGNSGSRIWIDANSSIKQFAKAYPSGLNGDDTQVLKKGFVKDVFRISYCGYMTENPTEKERKIIDLLPSEIKQEQNQ